MNKNYPLVSFIIATYNRKDYVCEAVRSILKQSYNNIEIIVIDDYSDDGTYEYLKNTFGDTITSFRNSSNMGPSFSRNKGLNIANGKYIGLLDSDDILYSDNHTKIAVDIMENDDRVAIFCCDFYLIDAEDNILNKHSFLLDSIDYIGFPVASGKRSLSDYYLRGLSNAGALLRRSALDMAGAMNVKYRIGWDLEYFLRILGKSRGYLYYYHKPLACYRKHPDCQTNNTVKSYIEKINIYKQIAREYPVLKKELGWKVNKRIAVQLISLSDAYKSEKRYGKALCTVIKALVQYPYIISFCFFSFLSIFIKRYQTAKLMLLRI